MTKPADKFMKEVIEYSEQMGIILNYEDSDSVNDLRERLNDAATLLNRLLKVLQ